MPKKGTSGRANAKQTNETPSPPVPAGRSSSLLDTRVVYCGLRRAQSSRDNLEQLAKLPDRCIDLIYIDPPFNSNRNYEVFWGETKEKRAFDDRHASTQAYIDYMRPRCVQLARVLKATGSFYYHCGWQRPGRRRPGGHSPSLVLCFSVAITRWRPMCAASGTPPG